MALSTKREYILDRHRRCTVSLPPELGESESAALPSTAEAPVRPQRWDGNIGKIQKRVLNHTEREKEKGRRDSHACGARRWG